jgi:hypothetical protein
MSDTRFLSLHIESTDNQVLVVANKILYLQELSNGTTVYLRDNHSLYVKETVSQIEEALR